MITDNNKNKVENNTGHLITTDKYFSFVKMIYKYIFY